MGARHQREYERLAATISAQGRRPQQLLPGRTRRHRRQPQRQTKKVTGMESSGGTVVTQRCFRFQETLVSYNQPCCTWNLKAPSFSFSSKSFFFKAGSPRTKKYGK